jgi:hypothetical protein
MWTGSVFLVILTMVLLPSGIAHSERKNLGAGSAEVVDKRSGGMSIVFPDVCKTPSAPRSVPIPYPDTGKSSGTAKGTKKIRMDGKPVVLKHPTFEMSTGDEAGTSASSGKGRQRAKPESDLNYHSSPRPLYPRVPQN